MPIRIHNDTVLKLLRNLCEPATVYLVYLYLTVANQALLRTAAQWVCRGAADELLGS